MSKYVGALCCVFFALVASASALPTTNLLLNPSFDNPTNASDWTSTYWTAGGTTPPNRETWAARMGYRGGAMPTWTAANRYGNVSQTVSVTGATVYTFSLWQRAEPNCDQRYATMKLEWLNAGGSVIQEATVNVYTNTAGLPIDNQWHQLAVTGTCTSQELAKVRVSYEAGWANTGSAVFFDDAQLYPGERQPGLLGNNSFEIPMVWDDEGWRHSLWMSSVDRGGADVTSVSWETWAKRSGNWGIAFRGWQYVSNRYQAAIWQNVYPLTGTCTFAVWLQSDPNAHISNFVMRVEWFDESFTNKVQTDSQTNVAASIVLDNLWHEYYLTTATTSPAAKEARLTLWADWTPGDNATLKMDDARFFSGAYRDSVLIDWGYHSGGSQSPALEMIPGTNLGTFLQVNYAATTTTFYALANYPVLSTIPEENGEVWVRTSWQRPPATGIWVDHYTNMVFVGTVTVSQDSQFHGSPAAGTNTLGLWKCDWPQPATNGVPYTNAIIVYYAPYIKSMYGPVMESQARFLVERNGRYTNNYATEPQLFDSTPMDKDYAYINFKPTPMAALTNGGFESPATNGFANTGWFNEGSQYGREKYWPAHTGEYGGFFSSWASGYGQVWQFLTATSGATKTFSLWIYQEPNFNPVATQLRLEWYNTDYQLVQVDVRDITTIQPKDRGWHQAYVTGTCTNNNIYYVKPVFISTFNGGGDAAAVFFDDAEFYEGPFVGTEILGNGSFEAGWKSDGNPVAGLRGSQWWTTPEELDDEWDGGCRRDWAYRSGQYGMALISFTNGNLPTLTNYYTTLSQSLTPGTGTYTFSVYVVKEDASDLTNMVLSINAYDRDFTLLSSTNRNITAELANYWKRFDLVGVINDPDTFEVRVNIFAQWNTTSAEGFKTCKIDDARFVRGEYPTLLTSRDWCYYNNNSFNPLTEQVPGTNVGAFMQIDYMQTATTFYVLSDTNIALRSDETGGVSFRIAYQNPITLANHEDWYPMTLVGTVNLDSEFHGLSGHTLNLWKYVWKQPVTNDAPITNAFTVYYTPMLRSYYGVIVTDTRWYADRNGEYTNNYTVAPQIFADWYYDKDWSYVNQTTNSGGGGITDGIPNWWWNTYGIVERIATNNPDADPADNMEEFCADTNPTNPASFYNNRITTNVNGYAIINIIVGPPTTNSRVYDVFWKTNLVLGGVPWVPMGYNVPGAADGGALTLSVTNDVPNRYYRSGVRVP